MCVSFQVTKEPQLAACGLSNHSTPTLKPRPLALPSIWQFELGEGLANQRLRGADRNVRRRSFRSTGLGLLQPFRGVAYITMETVSGKKIAIIIIIITFKKQDLRCNKLTRTFDLATEFRWCFHLFKHIF